MSPNSTLAERRIQREPRRVQLQACYREVLLIADALGAGDIEKVIAEERPTVGSGRRSGKYLFGRDDGMRVDLIGAEARGVRVR